MMNAAPPEDLVAFCRREHGRLVGALSLYTGDADLGRELAQEALLRACSKWPAVRSMAHPSAWLYRVGINLANSHFRRLQAERRATKRAGAVAVDHYDASGDLSARADALATRAALRRLPARQRTAVVLRFYLGLTVPEIAAAMRVRPGSVKQHLHRGLAALRRDLGSLGEPMEATGARYAH